MLKLAKQIAEEKVDLFKTAVELFTKNKDIENISVQNEFGAISISRATTPKSEVFAIGFYDSDDYDEAVDDDEDEDDVEEDVEF